MALKVKDIASSSEKWQRNAANAASEMAAAAIAAADTWLREAIKSQDNWKAGVSAAMAGNRFSRGIQRAGADKFSRKVQAVAESRFREGVGAGASDYRSGVEPYLAALAALTLDARKPRGDPANLRRVEQVDKLLNQKRLAMLSASS